MSQNNRHPSRYVDGFKGILGKKRAEEDHPSSYGGDRGGSASGVGGLPHGLGGGVGMAPNLVSSHGYGGTPICFEGGVRGGGVSECETMPAQYPYPKKVGYDEHRKRSGEPMSGEGNVVHGLPGVEGIDPVSGIRPSGHGFDNALPQSTDAAMTPGADGYGCPHGCGNMKSKHGLARHVHARHGGFGGLGKAMHGSSFKEEQEFRGETESSAEMNKIKAEFSSAEKTAKASRSSSYETGDCG